jgi:cytidylate kinase
MKREYDFSNATRGKFYRKEAELRLPIYLDTELQNHLERLAQKKGKELDEIVNLLIKREVELIDELT